MISSVSIFYLTVKSYEQDASMLDECGSNVTHRIDCV